MRLSAVDTMHPALPDFAAMPVRFEQAPARRTAAVFLLILVPSAAGLLFPFYLLASAALADGTLHGITATPPASLIQIALALALWLTVLGFPIYRLADSLSRTRFVEIAGGRVTVSDRAFGKTAVWSEPLTAFQGVAHHLRASLSGVRHELILVHPDPGKSLLAAMGPRLSQTDLERTCDMLGLPQLQAAAYYQRPRQGACRNSPNGVLTSAY